MSPAAEKNGQIRLHSIPEFSQEVTASQLAAPSGGEWPCLQGPQGSRWLCEPHCARPLPSLAVPVCDVSLSHWHPAQLRCA